MITGFCGKLLRINLSSGDSREEEIPDAVFRKYLGGRGLGAKILCEELKPHIPPLGEENKIIFSTGPLTGSGMFGCARLCITTKSPHTGTYLCSFSGGSLADKIKSNGYDAVVIEGRAEKPSYIWIEDGKVSIEDASSLWGFTTSKAEEKIKLEKKAGKGEIACIGPAGEHLLSYACVVNDVRIAGRGGAGAIMGSKHLKAIGFNGGSQKIEPKDKETFRSIRQQMLKIMMDDPYSKTFQIYGTQFGAEMGHKMGLFPIANFQQREFSNIEGISGEAFQKYKVKDYSCHGCPLGCSNILELREGKHKGVRLRGPEYETLFALGGHCQVSDPEAIIYANWLCDEYGIDTISTGVSIGFAMELYEKGLISKEDLGGLELTFGNADAMVKMVEMIIEKKGFGETLSKGVKYASQSIGKGAQDFAAHSKGLEFPGYDPRTIKGMGLAFATSPQGASHNRGSSFLSDPSNFLKEEEAPLIIKESQELSAVIDSLISCSFTTFRYFQSKSSSPDWYAKLLGALTGDEAFSSPANLLSIGERIFNLERCFNVRDGFSRKDDCIPRRFSDEPFPSGFAKGQTVDLDKMLNSYYQMRGWDEKGIPGEEKLRELDISDALR